MASDRPEGVPTNARWLSGEEIWIVESLDEDNERHGRMRVWLADGALAEDSSWTHGTLHGTQHYYRVARPRVDVLDRIDEAAVRIEVEVNMGAYITTRCYDAGGQEISSSGEPVPPRPDGVPMTASYVNHHTEWFETRGSYADGSSAGRSRFWYGDGTLKYNFNWDGDGVSREYHENGQLAQRGCRTSGKERHKQGVWQYWNPDGVWQRDETYEAGKIVSVSRRVPPERYRAAVAAQRGSVKDLGVRRGYLQLGRWQLLDDQGNELGAIDLGEAATDDELLSCASLSDDLRDAEAWLEHAEAALAAGSQAEALCAVVRALAAGDGQPGETLRQWCPHGAELTPQGQLDFTDEIVDAFDHWRALLGKMPLKTLLDALTWGARPAPVLQVLSTILDRVGQPRAAIDLIEVALSLEDNAPPAERRRVIAWRQQRASYLRAVGSEEAEPEDVVWPDQVRGDEAALLAAIADRPDDDDPRLVYADWLCDRGEPRGELIVVQCALARISADDLRRADLTRSEQELLSGHAARWLEPLSDNVDAGAFERGFVPGQWLYVTGESFAEHADALYRLMPTASGLTIDFPEVVSLCKQPQLARYRGLTLSDAFVDDDEWRHLAACPHLHNLETLRLYDSSLDDEGLALLAQSPHLAKLRELDISSHCDNEVRVAGIRALVASPHIRKIEALYLGRLWLDDEALELLCDSPHYRGLRSLWAACNHFGGAVTALGAWDGRLHHLDLNHNSMTDEGCRALVEADALSELELLDLGSNQLSDDGVCAIADSPQLSGLKALLLDAGLDQQTTARGARALACSKTLSGLQRLDLAMADIGDAGAEALAAGELSALTNLRLYQNGIGTRGAIAIASSEALSSLRRLDLDANNIGPAGARALAESKTLSELQQLHVAGNDIPEDLRRALRSRFRDVRFKYPWGGPD